MRNTKGHLLISKMDFNFLIRKIYRAGTMWSCRFASAIVAQAHISLMAGLQIPAGDSCFGSFNLSLA